MPNKLQVLCQSLLRQPENVCLSVCIQSKFRAKVDLSSLGKHRLRRGRSCAYPMGITRQNGTPLATVAGRDVKMALIDRKSRDRSAFRDCYSKAHNYLGIDSGRGYKPHQRQCEGSLNACQLIF